MQGAREPERFNGGCNAAAGGRIYAAGSGGTADAGGMSDNAEIESGLRGLRAGSDRDSDIFDARRVLA